jgi:hypothetical protein
MWRMGRVKWGKSERGKEDKRFLAMMHALSMLGVECVIFALGFNENAVVS